jgi:capsular exopolysaccharide synthesis family protein
MDYIQQAIDKARQQRGNNEAAPASMDERRVKAQSAAGMPEEINYTRTKTFKVDEDVLRNNRIIAGFNFDKKAEHYRQLRTQVLQKLRANNWKTLAVTSPGEGNGKSTTALNLAISLSKEVNQTVLLVDLDLRTPSLVELLEIDVEYGLVDHMTNNVAISDIMLNPGFERLVMLPGKANPNYSSELLSSPQMKELLEDITSRYESRLIIFDLPPLLVNDDALAFTPFSDAALLVVEDGVSSPKDIERCLQMLEGTNLIGSILNKAE